MNVSTLSEIQDHREAVWAQLSKELGGEFINEKGWAQDHVRVQYENWHLTLAFELHSGYRSEYIHTRFFSPVRPSSFRLRVFHQELIHKVGHFLGMQDFEMGDAAFDRMFVVQGTDEAKVRQLFQDAGLRRLMLEEPELEIRLRVPSASQPFENGEGCDELALEVPEAVEDIKRLRRLFDVFAHLALEMEKVGSEPCLNES
jgi:hypothetical protein